MSQNYKIVESTMAIAECHREEAHLYELEGNSLLALQANLRAAASDEAASLIKELGEALEGFARAADKFDGRLSDNCAASATLGDLRRARAILSKLKEA